MKSLWKTLVTDNRIHIDFDRRLFCVALLLVAIGATGCSAITEQKVSSRLKLIRFKPTEASKIVGVLRNVHGWSDLRMESTLTSQRSLIFSHSGNTSSWENEILDALISAGIDTNEVRIQITNDQILLENLSF